jgi:hypothetical protein
MDTPLSPPTARSGTPGLDVFKIAGKSISGFLHSLKTGDRHQVRIPYTTLEARLALFLTHQQRKAPLREAGIPRWMGSQDDLKLLLIFSL